VVEYAEVTASEDAETTTTEAPQLAVSKPKLSRWQELRLRFYVLKLRIFWWIAKKNGIMLLGVDSYAQAISGIAELTSYCERSGLLAHDTNARDQLRRFLGQIVDRLAFAESIAAPQSFSNTLGHYVNTRRATISKGQRARMDQMKAVQRRQQIDFKLTRSKMRAIVRNDETSQRFRRVAT
jgi:hypothetical protein